MWSVSVSIWLAVSGQNFEVREECGRRDGCVAWEIGYGVFLFFFSNKRRQTGSRTGSWARGSVKEPDQRQPEGLKLPQ